ncbi:hypothetical protein EIP86_002521 [Pleurotus ostreatoroseus]|nr:hypothetical protein EIP86_002521 [Pleurotus ostreatoroseus]
MPSKIKAVKPQKKVDAAASTSKATTSTKSATKSKSRKTKIIQPVEDSVSEDEEEVALPAADSEEEESSVLDVAVAEEGDDDSEEDGSEDEDEDSEVDVDEEGMTRLMKLLGEDGLDDVARSELEALVADEEISDEEDGDEEDGEEEDGEEEDDEEADEEADEESEEEEEEAEASSSKNVAKSSVAVNHEDEEDEEDAVLLEDADSIDEDAVPRQKIEIDNKIALERIHDIIKLDPSIPWTETLTVTYPETIDVDVDDDLNRELAFYKQALHCAQTAKTLAAKHNFPFTRPSDYFAEMVKSDSHMERIRQRLLDESATIKRGEEKRKEREGKKFGKQVQMEKLKERERSKKDMEERLKGLKRKRKGALDGAQGGDDFDVAVEDAIADRPSKRARGGDAAGGKHTSRQSRDKKFGFGGAGRRSKQNTKASTDNFEPRGAGKLGKGGRGGKRAPAKRPGKSKRMNARSRS